MYLYRAPSALRPGIAKSGCAILGSVGRFETARKSGAYQKWEDRTDEPLLWLALVFLVVMLVPLVFQHLSLGVRHALTVIEAVLWAIFVVDYGVRFILAPKRWRFFYTHIPELVVISVPGLRPLRSLKALRLLRLGGLSTMANQFARRSLATRTLLLVGVVTVIVVLTVAGVVLIFERGNPEATINTYPEALWWALGTVTTVGYENAYPTTHSGQVAGILLGFVGITLVGVITASIAAWFVRSTTAEPEPAPAGPAGASPAEAEQLSLGDVVGRLDAIQAGIERILGVLSAPEHNSPGIRRDGVKEEPAQLDLNIEPRTDHPREDL
jgi:voltage-gated potassium channel